MSALPCLTNTRPSAPIFSVTGGGGGIPLNQDITCSTLTAADQITCLGSQVNLSSTTNLNLESAPGNASANIFFQNAPGSGSATAMGYDTTTSSILITGYSVGGPAIPAKLNVDAEITTSTIIASTIINNAGLLNIGAANISMFSGLGVNVLNAGGNGGTLNLSTINVSSINGADVGGGSGLISSIGALDGFASGTSTVQVINTAAAPAPPVKMTPDMTLAPNRSYTFTAQADWSISPSAGNGEFLYWTVDGANTGFDIMRDFNSFGAAFPTTVPWANSFTLNTGPSTVNARLVVQLQPNLSVLPISSIISPPAAGYRWTLQDNGPIA